jgi:8-oxo-dGTP diphosphatase
VTHDTGDVRQVIDRAQERELCDELRQRIARIERNSDGGNKGVQCIECGEWNGEHHDHCQVVFYRDLLEALDRLTSHPAPSGWQQRIAAKETAYVVGFLFSRFEDVDVRRVVLVLKARPSWQAGRFNGVGGKIEPGETPLDAMRREFCEETGRFIEEWEPFVMLGGDGWRVHFFRAFTDIPLDSDFATVKTDEPIVSVKVSDIPSTPTLYNLRWLIPMALDGDVVAGKDRPSAWQNAVDALPSEPEVKDVPSC